MSRISVIVLTLCAAVSLSGQTAASTSKSAAPKQASPATSTVTAAEDRRIEASIRTKLAKSKISQDNFVFSVHNGIVTWEGSTAVPQHKGSATRMAKTAGAVAVVNNIRVNGVAGGVPPRHAQIK